MINSLATYARDRNIIIFQRMMRLVKLEVHGKKTERRNISIRNLQIRPCRVALLSVAVS